MVSLSLSIQQQLCHQNFLFLPIKNERQTSKANNRISAARFMKCASNANIILINLNLLNDWHKKNEQILVLF
jgi:hypothetical protein